jgi:hypothetical protein
MALSNVSWKGMKALEVILDILPTKMAKSKVKAAYKYALDPTKQAMLANIPKDRTGRLKHSIDITHGGTQELQQAFAVVGPRRKRFTWNMQGWHSHLIEAGTKGHTITAGRGKMMPIFKGGGVVGFAKSIDIKGVKGTFPFKRAMDTTWMFVADRVADKVGEIMRKEIKLIQNQYGNVVTKSDL